MGGARSLRRFRWKEIICWCQGLIVVARTGTPVMVQASAHAKFRVWEIM